MHVLSRWSRGYAPVRPVPWPPLAVPPGAAGRFGPSGPPAPVARAGGEVRQGVATSRSLDNLAHLPPCFLQSKLDGAGLPKKPVDPVNLADGLVGDRVGPVLVLADAHEQFHFRVAGEKFTDAG